MALTLTFELAISDLDGETDQVVETTDLATVRGVLDEQYPEGPSVSLRITANGEQARRLVEMLELFREGTAQIH